MSEKLKKIIYTCPYIPAEWIAAHGFCPSRVMLCSAGPKSDMEHREGLCPYVRSFINEVITNKEASAVLVSTLCDQMRRGFDIIKNRTTTPVFLMNVPHMANDISVQKLYLDELKRLGRFLCKLGGQTPSDNILAEIMLQYDYARKSILAARGDLTSRQFSEAIAEFNISGKCNIVRESLGGGTQMNSIPLAVVGGPLMKEDFQMFDVAKDCGGNIVLEATETGERGLCAAFDLRCVRTEPLMELATAYLGGIPDASRRPNNGLYIWLKRKLDERKVKGIIFHRYIWCDTWHAELYRFKQWVNLPVLDLDASGDEPLIRPRTIQRINSFLEMLQ
jgi:benzoyl-CoA reductase/2-hydroxyglutaryl-CoA dehydratase subunit BcrC/BadD/HgdB